MEKTEWLHWLVVNCNENNKNTIIQYNPPTPPKNSGIHKYYVCLYEQIHKIDEFEMEDNKETRLNFNMENFMNEHKLKCNGSIMFTTSNND